MSSADLPMSGAMNAMLDFRATGLSGRKFALRLLPDDRIAVLPSESFGDGAAGHVQVAMTVVTMRSRRRSRAS